jgi:hypothetical protein
MQDVINRNDGNHRQSSARHIHQEAKARGQIPRLSAEFCESPPQNALAFRSSIVTFKNQPIRYILNQGELACKKRFCVPFRRTTFHASEPRQSAKGFRIEPLLRTLRFKMLIQ